MVPREAQRGSSFKGAGLYYLHDKNASSTERVAFTHTENVPTRDPEKALGWMAWTAKNAEELKRANGDEVRGRKTEKPVFSFSLSWHPEEEPESWQMISAGRGALEVLGLRDHETLMVAHRDRDHKHLHVIVNAVHPETGRSSTFQHSKKKLSKWAEEYERANGKIYCQQRAENNKRRESEFVKYREPEISTKDKIAAAYRSADSGSAFRAALAEYGLKLAKSKRLVVVDADGTVYSLTRQLEGVKAADVKARLSGLDIPDLDGARGQEEKRKQAAAREKEQPVYFDRDAQDREWQESIIDAGINARSNERKRKAAPAKPAPSPTPSTTNSAQDRHLAEWATFYDTSQSRRQQLSFVLDNQYGLHERQLKRDIEQIDSALQSGRMRVWWMKLTGKLSMNAAQELAEMRQTLSNIEQRKAEMTQGLEQRIERQRAAIEIRQREERKAITPAADSYEAKRAAYMDSAAAECAASERPEEEGPELSDW